MFRAVACLTTGKHQVDGIQRVDKASLITDFCRENDLIYQSRFKLIWQFKLLAINEMRCWKEN